MTDLEQDLRRRFAVRTERFAHGDFSLELLLPRSAEDLIDESEFNVDERLPYWAELWPSARALTRFLLDHPPPASGRVIELGCGVALPSLALRARGAMVLATDYYVEALAFARGNAERNGIAAPGTAVVDWRNPPPDLGRFSQIIAADVLYERRNAEALAELLPHVIEPGGSVLLADPGRVYAPEFQASMGERGWTVAEEATLTEASPDVGEGVCSRVSILRLSPPAEATVLRSGS